MLSDPLQDLRDVHLPDPISWWPPAWGWWGLLLGILVGSLCLGAWWVYRRRTQPRRVALSMLSQIEQRYQESQEDLLLLTQISELVRRFALVRFPRNQVAGLAGYSWLQFLDETGRTNQFTEGPGKVLMSGPYRPQIPLAPSDLVPLVRKWICQASQYQKGTGR